MPIGVKSATGSYGAGLISSGAITMLLVCRTSTDPSGADRASVCIAMTPPAPATFSTTTGAPRALASADCAVRAITSMVAPAEEPTITRTGRSDWASDLKGNAAVAATAAIARRRVMP